MRWDDLFGELESDLETREQQQRDAEIADRTRAQLGAVRWVDRCVQARVGLRVAGVGTLHGVVDTVTSEWLLVHANDTTDWVVSLSAVSAVTGASHRAVPVDQRGQVAARMTWANAWTVLSKDRAHVHVVRTDGGSVSGLPVRVGRDFVEIAGGHADEPAVRSSSAVELVPYAAIGAVRCPR